jgi:hypothetical protein
MSQFHFLFSVSQPNEVFVMRNFKIHQQTSQIGLVLELRWLPQVVSVVVIAFSFLISSPVWAWVGYVVNFNGNPDNFQLTPENGETVKLVDNLFTPLKEGDEISILQPTNTIPGLAKENFVLLLIGKSFTKCVHGDNTQPNRQQTEDSSSYKEVISPCKVVREGDEGSSLPGAFANTALRWVSVLWAPHTQYLVTTVTKSTQSSHPGTVRIPLLNGTDNKLLATPAVLGERQNLLYLGWSGGEPPFTVKVFSGNEEIGTAKVEAIKKDDGSLLIQRETEVKLTKPIEVEKSYEVTIVDGENLPAKKVTIVNGKKKEIDVPFTFTAVTMEKSLSESKQKVEKEIKEAMKQLPKELQESVKSTWWATWWAQQDNGKWKLEAYQQVAKTKGYYPAEAIRYGLTQTDSLPQLTK